MMQIELNKEIAAIRARYGLSLAQFGSLVGAPATSVKRWEAGVDPREQFFFQLYLVLGLIKNPDEIFYDLGRQGVQLNKSQWDVFAGLVKGADRSIDLAGDIGLDSPSVGQTLVTGVRGLLALIAGSFAAKNSLGEKISASLATRIATFLK
jgi:transcriptional regulator with XRE-family HTH domain